MLLCYVDESGNTGDPATGGTLTYTLGCVIVNDAAWPVVFDELVALRRRLKSRFGIKVRDELKANYLLRGSGPMRGLGLSPNERHLVYRAHLRALSGLAGVRAFAVVVDKRQGFSNPDRVFDLAWEGLLQRLERTSKADGDTFFLIHDEGDNDRVRRWVRQSRRYLTAGAMYGTGRFTHAARLLVDDPSPRQSHQSYLIQMADLVAYAGFRSYVPPGSSIVSVCPATMWQELGAVTHKAVNRNRPRAAPGIVIR